MPATVEWAPAASHEDQMQEITRLAERYRAGEIGADEYFAAVARVAEQAVDEEVAGAQARRRIRPERP